VLSLGTKRIHCFKIKEFLLAELLGCDLKDDCTGKKSNLRGFLPCLWLAFRKKLSFLFKSVSFSPVSYFQGSSVA
jgi:hypothetical protein